MYGAPQIIRGRYIYIDCGMLDYGGGIISRRARCESAGAACAVYVYRLRSCNMRFVELTRRRVRVRINHETGCERGIAGERRGRERRQALAHGIVIGDVRDGRRVRERVHYPRNIVLVVYVLP